MKQSGPVVVVGAAVTGAATVDDSQNITHPGSADDDTNDASGAITACSGRSPNASSSAAGTTHTDATAITAVTYV
ncbi:hypothetical protein [Nocardia otitidiscaviarum]|uniref:hypothetical protein n=1 Tax=Nocardia otitidiscaviarum TaxID=1823 RepID=UPI0024545BE6|nr:hypothetical protein [Nocardia otitidiscaviarum]